MAGWNTVGPLARRVEDVRLALDVLSGSPAAGEPPPSVENRPLLVAPAVVGPPASRVVASVVQRATGLLGAAGVSVGRRVALPMSRMAFETTAVLRRHWLPSHRSSLGGGRPVAVWRELARGRRRIAGAVRTSLVPVALISSVGIAFRALEFGRAERIAELRSPFLDEMRDGAVPLMQVFSTTARRYGFSWGSYGSIGYTAICNTLGFAAVTVSVGHSGAGLPLPVQIITRLGEDETALAATPVLEREFGGWRMAMRERPVAAGVPGWHFRKTVSHGKESSKFNQDCIANRQHLFPSQLESGNSTRIDGNSPGTSSDLEPPTPATRPERPACGSNGPPVWPHGESPPAFSRLAPEP